MAATVTLGLVTGIALGVLMVRGTVCFNAGLRRAVADHDPTVLRIFAIAIAAQLIALPILVALGLRASPLPLLPAAQLAGGLVFGAGMALAGGCIAGLLWKTGAGSVATAIALLGFAAGELVMLGPGAPLTASLERVARPMAQTLTELAGLPYTPVAALLGAGTLVMLLRRDHSGAAIGLGVGAVGALAWLAGEITGYGYGLGFAGTAGNVRDALAAGRLDEISLPLFVAVGVIAGSAAVTRGPLRRPDAARTSRALAGGVLMGAGATVAHGCNIGHVLTGVPLLSLASLIAAGGMTIGALATWRGLLAHHPRLRGGERPEPAGW